MTNLANISFESTASLNLREHAGSIAAFAEPQGSLFPSAEPLDVACAGAVARAAASGTFRKLDAGEALDLDFPAGLAARAAILVKIDQAPTPLDARLAGAAIAKGRTMAGHWYAAKESHFRTRLPTAPP